MKFVLPALLLVMVLGTLPEACAAPKPLKITVENAASFKKGEVIRLGASCQGQQGVQLLGWFVIEKVKGKELELKLADQTQRVMWQSDPQPPSVIIPADCRNAGPGAEEEENEDLSPSAGPQVV